MKPLMFVAGILFVGCAHSMSPEYSVGDDKQLITYWRECEGVDLNKVSPEAKRLYLFMQRCVRSNLMVLDATPRQIARARLSEVYRILYDKCLERGRLADELLIEESGGTIEGLLKYLVNARNGK